jgi:DNA polymerase I
MTYLTKEEYDKYLRAAQESKYLAVDTEGTLNHPFSTTWGVSTSAGLQGDYYAFNQRLGENLPLEWLPQLKEVIENHPCLIFHNAKNDLRALRNLGINYSGKFYDTQLMAHMNNENYYSKELEYLSKMFGGDPKRNSELMDKIITAFGWDYVPVDIIRPYGQNDAFITEELFYKLYPDFKDQEFDGELWDIEQDFCRFLGEMEDNGVLTDQQFCERELDRGLKIMAEIKSELGFNPGSPNELGNFLLDELKLPPVGKRGKSGRYSFNKENMKIYDELLERNNDHRAKLIMTYRGWAKTTGSNYKPYLEKVSHDGRFRTSFKQHGTKTCRLSASILHQIPRSSQKDWNGKLKRAFISREGYTLWDFDFSQLEFRLKASYAQQHNLIEIFNDDTRDIFNEMAVQLGMERDPTKTLNYLLSYGGGVGKISHVFGVSEIAGKAIRDNYFRKYPGFLKFSRLAEQRARQQGYIRYWTKRRRHFQFESECHKADNAAIQGGAFEIVKRRILAVRRAGLFTKECIPNLQVHDDLVCEIENGKEHEYIPEIKRIMENVEEDADFGVRFRVDVHKWGSDEKYVPRAT